LKTRHPWRLEKANSLSADEDVLEGLKRKANGYQSRITIFYRAAMDSQQRHT